MPVFKMFVKLDQHSEKSSLKNTMTNLNLFKNINGHHLTITITITTTSTTKTTDKLQF